MNPIAKLAKKCANGKTSVKAEIKPVRHGFHNGNLIPDSIKHLLPKGYDYLGTIERGLDWDFRISKLGKSLYRVEETEYYPEYWTALKRLEGLEDWISRRNKPYGGLLEELEYELLVSKIEMEDMYFTSANDLLDYCYKELGYFLTCDLAAKS